MTDEFVNDDTKDEEWDQRVLCSDGNCIGVIGPDGRCNECGRPGSQGDGQPPPEPADFHGDTDQEDAPPGNDETEPELSEAQGGPQDADWEDRRLCSDGNCIGVIGPDGRCNECGRPHGESPTGD